MARVNVLIRAFIVWTAMALLPLTACVETDSIIRTDQNPDGSSKSSGDDAELTPPVPVGGTYLCLIDESNEVPDSVPGSVPGGCVMSASADVIKSPKKIVLGPELEVQMKVTTVFNEVIEGVEVREAPESSRFNWYVYIPRDRVDGARSQIRIIHKATQQERKEFSRFLRLSEPSISLERPTLTFGKDFDLHVGDTLDVSASPNAQINKRCTPESRGGQSLSFSGHRISVDFEVPDIETLVGITVEDICDSGSGQNTVSVKGPDGQYAALDQVGMESTSLLLESLKHSPNAVGPIRYTLTIEAAYSESSADYDDFIVGKVTFTSSKTLKLFDDSVKAEQRQPSPGGVYERPSVKANVFGAPTGATKANSFTAMVSGEKLTKYKYKVVLASNACSSMDQYSDALELGVPIVINMGNQPDGTYRLCVLGHDDENYWQPLASATANQWRRDTVAEPPVLLGAPVGSSATVDLDINVSGEDTRSYKFKLGVGASTDCANAEGYSADWVGARTNIKTSIASLADGTIRLCLVSRDALDNVLPFSKAKSVTWEKASPPPPAP